MAVLDFTRYSYPDLRYSAALVAPNGHGHYEPAGVYRIRKDGAGTVAWTITYAPVTPLGEAVEERIAGHRTLDGAKRVAVLDAERRIAEARNVAQEATQAPEPGILARLSSTITVEESQRGIQIWRESDGGDACITLHAEAEDKLLACLLARKGIKLQG